MHLSAHYALFGVFARYGSFIWAIRQQLLLHLERLGIEPAKKWSQWNCMRVQSVIYPPMNPDIDNSANAVTDETDSQSPNKSPNWTDWSPWCLNELVLYCDE